MNEAQDIFRNILTCVALVFASGVLFAIYLVGRWQLVARLGAARFTSYAMIVAAICCIAEFTLVGPISGLFETPLLVLATSAKRQNCLGTAVMQITSSDQGLDLAVGDTALEHPEAAIGMNVFDPFGAEHLFGALDRTRDRFRRLDLG
jgi:hypothetical protein